MKLQNFFKRKFFLALLMFLSSMTLISCGNGDNSLSANSLKKIELDTTQESVEKVLGKPHDISESNGEKWYYFDDSFKKKYNEVKNLLENGETIADFEKADKLYTEMEKMTYKCTMIKFNGSKKVTEIFYDAKHKYEEFNDYATTSKTLSEVELSISDVQYYVEETEDGSSTKFTNVNKLLSYEASFSDGSYIHSYANGAKTILDGNSAVVTWKDEISNYKVNKKANKVGTLNNDGNFTLEYAKGDIVLPECITEITDEMFLNNTELTSVIIPNSVKTIGKYAFKGCCKLNSVTFEEESNVTSIGFGVFEKCTSLESLTLPYLDKISNSLGDINLGIYFGATSSYYNSKFVPSSLNEVIITGGSSIPSQAFSECGSLTSIKILNSVTSIGNEAFSNCSSLTSIVIPNSIAHIDSSAFWGCTSLQYNEYGNCLYLGNEENPYLVLVKAKENQITNARVFNNTKLIMENAFSNCSSLTSIVIPNSLTIIGSFAFYGCSSLTSITIPNSVTSIGSYAFFGCGSLTSVTFEEGSKLTSIGSSAFSNCSSLQYNEYGNCLYLGNEENPYLVLVKAKDTTITEATISNNTRFIMDSAFEDCNSLTAIVIPNSVTSIGSSAFYGCSSLSIIYCEVNSKPSGWSSIWNDTDIPVYWAGQWSYINGVPTPNK